MVQSVQRFTEGWWKDGVSLRLQAEARLFLHIVKTDSGPIQTAVHWVRCGNCIGRSVKLSIQLPAVQRSGKCGYMPPFRLFLMCLATSTVKRTNSVASSPQGICTDCATTADGRM
jgi:hypothetical protein